VLGLSLGASAVYSPREWLDFTYQVLGILFGVFAVALVLFLLWQPGRSAFRRIGFDRAAPRRDVLAGVGLLLVIGIPGLGLYLTGRALGFTVAVVPSPIDTFWWTIPILVLSALRAALLEEIIVVGYLFTRLRELGWSRWTVILSSATLRGSYHLYQGVGPFFGNVAMGIVFGWCYERWGRTMPLIVTHWLLDILSFVGYPLALAWFPALLAPAS